AWPLLRIRCSGVQPKQAFPRGHHMSSAAPNESSRSRGRARQHVRHGESVLWRTKRLRFPIRFALVLVLVSQSAVAEIQPSDCASAAKYSESRRGSGMLVMQNGRTIFEHYANGGSANRRWPIFSGTKSFWGIAALAAAHDGLLKLDDPVSDTI